MGVSSHTWLVDWLHHAVHVVGFTTFDLAAHGLRTMLGFVGF
jgi:hypothetical protein